MDSSASRSQDSTTNGPTHTSTKDTIDDDSTKDRSGVAAKRPFYSKAWTWWVARTGIDVRTYQSMFKGALAPTIAITFYQATAVADEYTTVGYLVGVMAVLSVVIAPRGKFMQTMVINVCGVCLACAICLLAMYCAVQARLNSGDAEVPGTGGSGTSGLATAGAETAPYSSSASAVAAVWLFVEIYMISVIRALRPQFTIPCICAAIFANVSSAYVPQFSTMGQAETFAQHLLTAMLTGFAIATGVSLFIFPLTSRQIVFTGFEGYLKSLQAAVNANLDYIHSLEEADMFTPRRVNTIGEEVPGSKEANVLKSKISALTALHAKLSTDLPFAKREISVGKLGPDDLQSLYKFLRRVMVPTISLSSLSDIFQRSAEDQNWDSSNDPTAPSNDGTEASAKQDMVQSVKEWHELMKSLREPFGQITAAINEGLEHVAISLQLGSKKRRHQADTEAGDSQRQPRPGEDGFVVDYDRRSLAFLSSKQKMLREWCALHNASIKLTAHAAPKLMPCQIILPGNFFDDPSSSDFEAPKWMHDGQLDGSHRRLRHQLFVCLFVEFLLFNISRRVYDMILFVEEVKASGKLNRTRLVVPGYKRMRKWVAETFTHRAEGHDAEQIDTGGKGVTLDFGAGYDFKKDPEHLPPSTAWQKSSNWLRQIPKFLASPASSFGFRVAVATMSIAIVCFLKDTQVIYTEQRLFWSQIMISISMSPSAGQSLRNFGLRIFGTAIAMLLAWIAYYVVDGHVAGVLVLMFVAIHLGVWVLLKHPSITPVGMISQITVVLIVGYELQVRKIGIERATSNGQAYWPAYILGPIRLATVCGGLALAWFWTWFPYPMTESSVLRKSTAKSMYLMANYYSVLQETFKAHARGDEVDGTSKDSPHYKLDKARLKIYAKTNILIESTRAQAQFVRFDIPIGGAFPRQKYTEIIGLLQDSLNYMALISVASASFTEAQTLSTALQHHSTWLHTFRPLITEAASTSQALTTLLSLLSSALDTPQPLPPYLTVPEPWSLTRRLEALDRDLFSVRHIAEPGYSSLAVIQIAQKCLVEDLRRLLAAVCDLVGDLDFSWKLVRSGGLEEGTGVGVGDKLD